MSTSFVAPDSIVRKIWGQTDIVLFIFAGAAAEFALNKAVDWLFFTGRLPEDPLGRLCSTVGYARAIIFTEESQAHAALRQVNHIHAAVESSRHARIPPEAYRDVLYLLIHYSIVAFELLERKLSAAEREEIVNVFRKVGRQMQLEELPEEYTTWRQDRQIHLENNLIYSNHTQQLFRRYRSQLGSWRYRLMLQVQQQVCPPEVRRLLSLENRYWLGPLLRSYKLIRDIEFLQRRVHYLLPAPYPQQLLSLHRPS